jgi:GAF domain-containing protein
MLAAPSGVLQVVASSNEAIHTLELFQLESGEGPCVEAYRTGEQVVNQDLSAGDERWPRFAATATANGFLSAHSFPLRLRGRFLGALNLLHTESGSLDEHDIDAAQGLADIATIAIVQHQVMHDAQSLSSQLNEALNSRIVIEQAKGKISQARNSDMDQAFRQLRNHARNHNLLLAALAAAVADGTVTPDSLDRLKAGS